MTIFNSVNNSHIHIHSDTPSDGFGLADKVGKFAVSSVWQQHANNSSHDADCAKNNVREDLAVNTCKQNIRHWS